jgi:ribosomal protein S18 acetylase RimI-like enzyme
MVPIPSNPKLAGIEYVTNPDHEMWNETVHLIYDDLQWFLSEDDYDTWLAAFGPDNFNLIVALETAKNQVVGCISVARFESEKSDAEPLVTIGMFFVRPSHRKIGLGIELWNRAFEDRRFQNTNTGLIAVEEMAEKYKNMHGFGKIPETRLVNCRGIASDIHARNLIAQPNIRVIDFRHACAEYGLEALAIFDASVNGGIRRDRFIKAWLEAPNSLASHIAVNQVHEIVGYISLRKSLANDIGVAPLYAKTPEIAQTLLRHAFESVQNLHEYRYVFFSPLTTNQTARKIYVKLTVGTVIPISTLVPQFTCTIPSAKSENIYSVTDFATCAFF